jgi:ornithine cyclodeaminase
MAAAYALDEIRVCDPHARDTLAAELTNLCGVPVRMCHARDAVDGADIVVTASRSPTPLFGGDQLAPGTFVAAIGSSLPHTRELDDAALSRAAIVAVDWRPQTLREAGDLVMAGPGVLPDERIVDLADLVAGKAPGRQSDEEITIYKSVGVGLQDVALAGLAWTRLMADQRAD